MRKLLLQVWYGEPAAVLAALGALVSLAVGFGAPISKEQAGLVMAAVSALSGVATRSRVSPVRHDAARRWDDDEADEGDA